MPSCNRREFLIRAGLVRPQMISDEQKARFVAACTNWNAEAFRKMPQNREPWPKVNVAHLTVLAWVLVSAIAIVVLS